jgi:two-component system cell cycle sensor histidine kinase/response regulator CckA
MKKTDDVASESNQPDEALRASESRYRRLFETAQDGILILDGNSGLIIDVNPFLINLLDYPRIEFIGKTLWDMGPFVNIEASKAAFLELQDKEYIRYDDLPLEAKSGRRINVEFVSNVYGVNGKRVIQCNIRDITARRDVERALRRSEAHFSAVVNSAMDGILAVDSGQRIVLFNTAAEKMFGYTAEEMAGQPLGQLLPERFREPHAQNVDIFAQTNATGPRVDGFNNLSALRANGQVFSAEASISGTEISGEQYFTVIIRDVTERVHAAEELRKSEERFSKAFRCSPLASAISTEADGRYLDVNEAFIGMLQCKREDVVGRTSVELGFWIDPSQRIEMLHQLEKNGRVTGLRAQYKTYTGEILETEVSAETVEIEGQRCVLAITRDITKAMRMEAQFLQAQKMEAVGRLASGMAHDFNNILGVIIGYGDLSLDLVPMDNPAHKHLEQIKRASNRAVLLTRQLLAFSRQQLVLPKILDLNAVVQNMVSMLMPLVGEDVSVSFRPAPAISNIKADPSQLEQVLMNLAVNARDAMPGGGRILIETGHTDLDEQYVGHHPGSHIGQHVVLAVSDTGCGMDENIKSKIFEPFFTTKSVGQGTGLGLSTVHGIVEQSGGSIFVYSEPGKGTTFKIYFPRVVEKAEYPVLSEQLAGLPGGSETLLLAEDDEPLRKLTVSILEGAGYRVIAARDGDTALSMLQASEQAIDLLLTDVIMPGKSGVELVAGAKLVRPNLRSLFMSGYAADLIALRGELTPDVAFLEKPFTRSSLLTKVHSVLHDESANKQSH